MSNTKLTKSVIDLFFKEHKDAAAVFVMAGLTTAEIERAIVIIGREEINPGNRKGYEAVARQILKKRQPESAVNNSEQKELPLGISKPNPAVFPIADSDPRVAGVPYQERGCSRCVWLILTRCLPALRMKIEVTLVMIVMRRFRTSIA